MPFLIFLLLCLLIAIIVLPFVAMSRAGQAARLVGELSRRLTALEKELRSLKQTPAREAQLESPPLRAKAEVALQFAPVEKAAAAVVGQSATPPPLASSLLQKSETPPGAVVQPAERPANKPIVRVKPPINWEQFMGAKLFAWIGGVALFLGVAFFVKYSFEHNLIPPEVRVAIGFLTGIGLIGAGVAVKRKAAAVTGQTLCATGVLILYAVTFACRALYHFPFFGVVPTFALMFLITAAAFVLAVRMNALVVAVLGIAGGFLTPVLLSTGQDAPFGLFGYIALLDFGLLAVASRKKWNVLPILGAAGTGLMQVGWVARFFVEEKYFAGSKTLLAMGVFVAFEAMFLAAVFVAKKSGKSNRALLGSTLGLGALALLFSFFLLSFTPVAIRPVLFFSYVFVVNAGLFALVLLDDSIALAEPAAGLLTFALLAAWTGEHLTNASLNTALAFYFLFALFHSAAPIVMQRVRAKKLPPWCHAFPALALVLVLMPIFKLAALSFFVWPFVLLVDLLAIVLAALSATLVPILFVLVLTLVTLGAFIFRIPGELTGLPTALFLIGGFAVFFLVAALWLCRKMLSGTGTHAPNIFGRLNDPANLAVQLPALSAALPFLLLTMVTLRLPLANPSPVFGLALVLLALLLGLAKIMSLDVLPAVGLACVLGLEHAWHFHQFNSERPGMPLLWHLIFYASFTAFPFSFHRQFGKKSAPWAVSALAGPLHFFLVHQVVRAGFPSMRGMMGVLPALFAVPALLGLVVLLKRTPSDSPARNAQLAWWGGVALFFITLIFPIQFERQWITIGWACEGAALCWLFRRVPHPGLRLAGVALLVASFARLALNPAVLEYHPRATVALFNWYLYAYGLGTIALFAGARLLAGRDTLFGRRTAPMLAGMGTVLGFLLVNLEIADYFTAPGARVLTFELSANLARDMSFSIAWALFALMLLVIGIRKKLAPVRYASLGLLGVTVLKLFLHDLSQLDQLYRIGAFIAVAVIAMVASYLYQRFVVLVVEPNENPTAPPSVP